MPNLTLAQTKRPRKAREAMKAANPEHVKDCPVCISEKVEEIENRYLNWRGVEWLAREYGFPEAWIRDHVRVFCLHARRRKRTPEVQERIIEMGLEQSPEKLNVRAKDVIAAAQWLDKVDGRVTEHVMHHGPQTVVLQNFPRPGGVIARQQEESPTFRGELVAAGPPLLAPPNREESGDAGTSDSSSNTKRP